MGLVFWLDLSIARANGSSSCFVGSHGGQNGELVVSDVTECSTQVAIGKGCGIDGVFRLINRNGSIRGISGPWIGRCAGNGASVGCLRGGGFQGILAQFGDHRLLVSAQCGELIRFKILEQGGRDGDARGAGGFAVA